MLGGAYRFVQDIIRGNDSDTEDTEEIIEVPALVGVAERFPDLPITEDLGNRIARLPFYTSLADEGLDYTIESMKEVLVNMYGF